MMLASCSSKGRQAERPAGGDRQGIHHGEVRETVAWARELLGGNGILVDNNVARLFADAEAIYSYEGTYQMQNLIVGKAITGFSAFV